MHRAHADFWKEYRAVPAEIRDLGGQAIRVAWSKPASSAFAIQEADRTRRTGTLVRAGDAQNTAPLP